MRDAAKRPRAWPALAIVAQVAVGGCAVIDDMTIRPKSASVNTGWSEYRNNSILLNIVRGENAEPLNFVAFSKYTGTGEMDGSLAGQAVTKAGSSGLMGDAVSRASSIGADGTYGPFGVSGKTANSI